VKGAGLFAVKNNDGEVESLQYCKLVAVLWQTVASQNQKIQELTARVAALE